MNENIEVIEPEVVDVESDFVDDNKSAVESLHNIYSYKLLIQRLKNLPPFTEFEELTESEKVYSAVVGREILINIISLTKPPITRSEEEEEILTTAFGFLYSMAQVGEYPFLSIYANHIGLGLEEFFIAIADSTTIGRDIHAWVYNILESANQMNMIRKNGDFTARKWQEESSEFKVKAVDRMAQNNVRNLIEETKKRGELIDLKELMRSDN